MHQIGVVGLSYRHAGVDEIARFSVPRGEIAARLEALSATLAAAEGLYVGTCHRIELLYATRDRRAPRRVALLGVSPMTRRGAPRLHEARVPLLIVNRTAESAAELARSVAGEWLSLDDFRGQPPPSTALVLAAGGGQRLLDEGVLARLKPPGAGALVIDFGVPPNVEPEAARRAGWERLGMDELIAAAQGRRLTQLVRLAPVRAAIDERLARLRAELAARAIGARLAGLKGDFEEIAALEVARALRGELRTLDARERAQLQRLASGLARRLAHLPLAGLRAAAVHAGPDAVEAFFHAARSGRTRADGGAPADGKHT